MGFPLDVAAQNASLDAWLGDDHASVIPSSFEVALFTDHPLFGGTELTSDGGYGRVTLANTSANFPDAVGGLKSSVPVSFGTSTDAFSDTALYAVLYDAADSVTQWFAVLLTEEVAVVVAGTVVEATLSIYWNTGA